MGRILLQIGTKFTYTNPGRNRLAIFRPNPEIRAFPVILYDE